MCEWDDDALVDEDEQRKEETQAHRAQRGQPRQLFKLGKLEDGAVVDVKQRNWRKETTTVKKNETMTDREFAARNPSDPSTPFSPVSSILSGIDHTVF